MPNIKNILIFLTLSSFLILPCNADVYRYIDKHGRVIFTDKPEHKGYKKLVRTWKGLKKNLKGLNKALKRLNDLNMVYIVKRTEMA